MSIEPQPAAADGGVRERDLLADAIAQAGIKCGLLRPDIEGLTGPQLLMVCQDMADALSSHRQAGDEAATLRWAAAVLDMWEGDPNETGYMGDFGDACAILNLLADHAPYTAPPPGADLSKFRELAERWRTKKTGLSALGCANELLALVEKGAGNGQ